MKTQNIKIEVTNKVIELEITKGHLRWKVSDLSRITGVSRQLIYYHFGKTKKEILESSVDVVANEYFGLAPERIKLLKEGKAWKSLNQTRKMFLDRPAFFLFYTKWRLTKSVHQTQFINIEKRYQQTLKELFPHLTQTKVIALHAILQGVATAPFLTKEAGDEILNLLEKL
jgi:AcrR family transcriptional regulator